MVACRLARHCAHEERMPTPTPEKRRIDFDRRIAKTAVVAVELKALRLLKGQKLGRLAPTTQRMQTPGCREPRAVIPRSTAHTQKAY